MTTFKPSRQLPWIGALAATLLCTACTDSGYTDAPPAGARAAAAQSGAGGPPSFVPEFAAQNGPSAPRAAPAKRRADVSPDGPSPRQDASLDTLMTWEREDHGVRPPRGLRQGEMHGATPSQLPGGQVITTKGLLPLLRQGIPVYVFDVLGAEQSLPQAIAAAWAAEPGDFEDETQQRLAQLLQQVTRGDRAAPLVFYCAGPQCWMSYNAALRAVHLGYRNVLWYRGGMEAWARAGQRSARGTG
jgi:PQQ-dependent catabolism-associated CXXCW motif protein